MILEAIQKALPVFAVHKDSSWETLAAALEAAAIPEGLVDDVIEFMPLAFGRVFLERTGVRFDAHYCRADPVTGTNRVIRLNDHPFYREAFETASFIVARKMTGPAFTAVALRSAELHAVNNLLLQGSNPADIQLAAPELPARADPTPPAA